MMQTPHSNRTSSPNATSHKSPPSVDENTTSPPPTRPSSDRFQPPITPRMPHPPHALVPVCTMDIHRTPYDSYATDAEAPRIIPRQTNATSCSQMITPSNNISVSWSTPTSPTKTHPVANSPRNTHATYRPCSDGTGRTHLY